MNTSVISKKITFTRISNESQLDQVVDTAEQSKCKVTISMFSTKAEVTGSPRAIKTFIKNWNKG